MSKQWIKVKALARELGVTSRTIIDRCRAEGYTVQNSVSRLHPDVEHKVREWLCVDTRRTSYQASNFPYRKYA